MDNKKTLYSGIFFLCLSLLLYEIVLTRIFSVLLWYHFAFLVISVALFGNGVSALFIFIAKKWFPEKRFEKDLLLFSFLVPLSMVISIFILLAIDIKPQLSFNIFSADFMQLLFVFILSALPFLFGGMCLVLALYHKSADVHKIYFYDLFGAGVGCLLTVPILSIFGGPGGIIFAAVMAGFASLSFSYFNFSGEKNILVRLRKVINFVIIVACISLAVSNIAYKPIFRIQHAKAYKLDEMKTFFNKWNSYSMVLVYKDKSPFICWGISPKYEDKAEHLRIFIDMGAFTCIIKFNGDLNTVDFVKYDYSSLVYWLKKDYNCCIIGTGGGKDILSALALGAKSVVGVEINSIIANDVMRDKFLDYSGGVYEHPKVDIKVDDGRSFVRKTEKKFDIIQLSMVDTSAATAAGAYVLSENSLYTTDAFLDYLSKLNPEGILSVSWVNFKVCEGGTRLVSLARAALEKMGVSDISKNIIVLKHPNDFNYNVMVKKEPFTQDEIKAAYDKIIELGFIPVHIPNMENPKSLIEDIIYSTDLSKTYKNYHLDMSPVSDERPFFFYQNRLKDFFSVLTMPSPPDFFGAGLFILAKLIMICMVMTLIFLILPLFLHKFESDGRKISSLVKLNRIVYFICLGIGFMFIEIPLIQRFILFLGHPIYSLSVVLLAILCFCGLGSYLTDRIAVEKLKKYLSVILLILIIEIVLYYFALTPLLKGFLFVGQKMKILLSLVILAPLGLMLGMCFPAGYRLMDSDTHTLSPWFWAMNSAASVFGSVLSVFIAINFGLGFTMLCGGGIYSIALLMILFLKKSY